MVLNFLKYLHYFLGCVLVVISLIPLIRNDNWVFRIFEYPRAQKLFINVFLLVAFFVIDRDYSTYDYIFLGVLSANFLYLGYQVWPYTFFASHQLKGCKASNSSNRFTLLIANVFQDNRDVDACYRAIRENRPDMVMLVETDQWWKEELDKRLRDEYTFYLGQPQENTYGMVLYSKLELLNPQIKFLVEEDIPSIHTDVRLPNNDVIRLYGLHPTPPVPQENPRSTERDAEILMVAKEAKTLNIPVIVAGDMNDVAWSYTTELFLKVSKLLDPRRGRGFFNTFHAKYRFLRWPLDHVFCSTHFHLASLKRLPGIGSDHFPIMIELHLLGEKARENEKETLDVEPEEEKMATKKIRKVKQA